MPALRIPVPSEADEQAAVVAWLRAQRLMFFHVPNGGHRAWKTARSMKRVGTQPGVPDLWIVTPPPRRPDCVGTVVEMKRRHGGALSLAQLEWLEELERLSWCCLVCHGAEEAIRAFRSLGYETLRRCPRDGRRNRDRKTA